MKIGKYLLLMGLSLSIFLSGCNYEEIIDRVAKDLGPQNAVWEQAAKPPEPFIGFSETDVESPEELDQRKPEELQNYTSRYSEYNTYTYFAHLNDAEKLLYHAYEYALDEAQSCFWIAQELLQEMERPVSEVLEFLSLDSALVGQNYEHRQGEATLAYSNGDTEEKYLVILVDNFDREELQRKEEAIAKAKQILSEMPAMATKRETAEYFYDYLGNNVTYVADMEGRESLYTALCEGKTNCDGYTNAFALLCSMADIPCVEIISDTPKGEIGHTWNGIYLEDRWVHVDCTVSKSDVTSECKNCREERPYFGFSDGLLVYPILHESIVPDSPQGLTPVLNISSGKIKGFINKVKEEFAANDGKLAVILVDEGDLEDQINDELVSALNISLYYLYYKTAEGKTVYYLFNNGS